MKAPMTRTEWYLQLADIALRGSGKQTDFKLRNRRNVLEMVRKRVKTRQDELQGKIATRSRA